MGIEISSRINIYDYELDYHDSITPEGTVQKGGMFPTSDEEDFFPGDLIEPNKNTSKEEVNQETNFTVDMQYSFWLILFFFTRLTTIFIFFYHHRNSLKRKNGTTFHSAISKFWVLCNSKSEVSVLHNYRKNKDFVK